MRLVCTATDFAGNIGLSEPYRSTFNMCLWPANRLILVVSNQYVNDFHLTLDAPYAIQIVNAAPKSVVEHVNLERCMKHLLLSTKTVIACTYHPGTSRIWTVSLHDVEISCFSLHLFDTLWPQIPRTCCDLVLALIDVLAYNIVTCLD